MVGCLLGAQPEAARGSVAGPCEAGGSFSPLPHPLTDCGTNCDFSTTLKRPLVSLWILYSPASPWSHGGGGGEGRQREMEDS